MKYDFKMIKDDKGNRRYILYIDNKFYKVYKTLYSLLKYTDEHNLQMNIKNN